MVNSTKSGLVFLQGGNELHTNVVSALIDASKWILQAYKLEDINLSSVSTKTFAVAALPAHVERSILPARNLQFDENYVRNVFEFVSIEVGHCSYELYGNVTRTPIIAQDGEINYRKSYLVPLRRGFSVFLAILHMRRQIVLPFSFFWPRGYEKIGGKKFIGRRELIPLNELPELIRLFRSLDYRDDASQTEEVFNLYDAKQRERLVYMGQRLVIAAGWLELNDVCYEDMLALKMENDKTRFSGHEDIGLMLITDLLTRKYGSASPVNADGWRKALTNLKPTKSWQGFENVLGQGHNHLVQLVTSLPPAAMVPESLAEMNFLPGLEFDLKACSQTWVSIQRTYLRKMRKENKYANIAALGHVNTYLFGYLPYWFAMNRAFTFDFPATPSQLISSVFVSDLGLLEGKLRPLCFVEFLNAISGVRKWSAASHYAVLKQIELFFKFIERHSDGLPGAENFRQPLSRHDYPKQTTQYGTKKRPIPRRVFKLFLSYIESLAELSKVLVHKVISGELQNNDLRCFDKARKSIDIRNHQDLFGFVPIVFHKGKAVPIWQVPNVFYVQPRNLKDGRTVDIPHPHALHQLIVSLYTGLRQNHIQWLDRFSFDAHLDIDQQHLDFAELFVNTDKVKTRGWKPFVNFRVIQVLRQQREWFEFFDEPGFNQKIFYNNNAESKWGSFCLLFSFFKNGEPHTDALYAACWARLLSGLQTLLNEVGEYGIRLVRLLPSGVQFDDPNIEVKLKAFGAAQKRKCAVNIKSNITPHSARVSVVSHGISVLPADVIGRHWTGQSEATVYHYVVPDEEEVYAEQQRQNLQMRNIGYEQGYEALLVGSLGNKTPFIKADEVNSNLSISLKSNLDEAIAAYGCISLFRSEDGQTGLEILRDTRGLGILESKTEICPYGGHCPPNVVSELKGWRRCGPCKFAVRSIDHLPAILAKIRQIIDGLSEVEVRISGSAGTALLTGDELDNLEYCRDMLAEDLAAWQMSAEVLEVMRQRIAAGTSEKTWHVYKPEIVEKHLVRQLFPTNATEYLIARLRECEAFPMLESPQVKARFELLRRQLLANTGNIRAALSLEPSLNPGVECLGLLRSIVAAHKLTLNDLKKMLESDCNLDSTPSPMLKMLATESE